MCGRFTLTLDSKQIQDAYPWLNVPAGIQPRYNVAPSQPIAVVPNDGKQRLDFYVWGLIPSWAKDPNIGNRMINARGETLAEKPSFRNAYKRRRCLILADGFYEWKKAEGSKSKIPMFIHLKDRQPFAFAGLWELWNAPDGSQIYSATIITTEPNSMMKSIHNRMPVILPQSAYEEWLSPGERDSRDLAPLLEPFPPESMQAYAISTLVNSPQNDLPQVIEPAVS
ncbi:MAG: SOS response-associated peptidase [Anaerolineales bacterium]|jgi:putative SOS response-associated peptidase YedK